MEQKLYMQTARSQPEHWKQAPTLWSSAIQMVTMHPVSYTHLDVYKRQAQGIGSCWIHRAKEEFESEEGKELLRSLGIEGDYEGIGHCILGYADGDAPKAAPRKDSYVYYVE